MARGAMAFVRGTIRQGTVSDAKNEGERTLVSALGQLLSGAKYGVFALWPGKSDGPDAPVSIYRVSLFRHMPETVAALGRRTARTYMNP